MPYSMRVGDTAEVGSTRTQPYLATILLPKRAHQIDERLSNCHWVKLTTLIARNDTCRGLLQRALNIQSYWRSVTKATFGIK